MKKPLPYTNREISWVHFNRRVLAEGCRARHPPLERLKILGIVSSNFDEFFMVRMARLVHAADSDDTVRCHSGRRPSAILTELTALLQQTVREQAAAFTDELVPVLQAAGLQLVRRGQYTEAQRDAVRLHFRHEVFPALTPVAVAPGQPLLPLTVNLRLHLAFLLRPGAETPHGELRLALLQVPPALDRFGFLPAAAGVAFSLIEDVIVEGAAELFAGYEVAAHAVFRVTRDADLTVDESEDEGFAEALAEVLVERQHSPAMRLELATAHAGLRARLIRALGLRERDVYEPAAPLDLKAFLRLCTLPGFDHLRAAPWTPQVSPALPPEADPFAVLKARDVLLHHPYESFAPVEQLLSRAADDPQVVAIRMTLYRTSGDSPVVKALARAAENGKQVTVLVELKARFDEERNLGWADLLERAGAIVVHGIANLKVHAKALLIVRREPDGIARYVHLGTGNYNDRTARLYTDFGLLSSRDDLAHELTLVFNAITGYASTPVLRTLALAPAGLRQRLTDLIEREIERQRAEGKGLIVAKLNSLVDAGIVALLYRAAQAGVEVRLNVRGICCLRPGLKGVSERIRVVSILDCHLEHARVFLFRNGGATEVYLSSADWMPRNLNRRVELLFPVDDPALKARLRAALDLSWRDNQSAYLLQPDGTYRRLEPRRGEARVRSQEVFQRQATGQATAHRRVQSRELAVRRKPPRRRRPDAPD